MPGELRIEGTRLLIRTVRIEVPGQPGAADGVLLAPELGVDHRQFGGHARLQQRGQLPGRRSNGPNEGPVTFTAGHYFTPVGDLDLGELAESATAPLSVIVQVTKRCDFGCVFCSETLTSCPGPGSWPPTMARRSWPPPPEAGPLIIGGWQTAMKPAWAA
jgi:hypothetical protein